MWAEQTSDADKSLRVLIVSGDRALEEEFRSALSRIPDRRGSVYFVETYRDLLYDLRGPTLFNVVYLSGWAAAALWLGTFVFNRFEGRLAEEL